MNILLFLLCINFYCSSQTAADEITPDFNAMTLNDNKEYTPLNAPTINTFSIIQGLRRDPEKYRRASNEKAKEISLKRYCKDPLNPNNKKWPVSISMAEFAQNDFCTNTRTRVVRGDKEFLSIDYFDNNAMRIIETRRNLDRMLQQPPLSMAEEAELLSMPFITSFNNHKTHTTLMLTIYNPSCTCLQNHTLLSNSNEELLNTKTTLLNLRLTGVTRIYPIDYKNQFPNIRCIALSKHTPDCILQENIAQNPGITFILGGKTPVPNHIYLPITPLNQGEVDLFPSADY